MRYDFIIIWGHGLSYKDHILDMINQNNNFEIVKIIHQQIVNIEAFVKKVYSCDYAPFEHLEAKTRYLMATPAEVCFIFLKNFNPDEEYKGEGEFKHIESRTLRELKEAIRNNFNPRVDGIRTEEHVIHSSDSESQTHFMLKYLGYPEGTDYINQTPNPIFPFPYHLPPFQVVTVKKIPLKQLFCNFFSKENGVISKEHQHISCSPHFRFLRGDENAYKDYLQSFSGNQLTDYYSLKKFKDLATNFTYLTDPHQLKYLVVTYEQEHNHYTILDGLHRAAILLAQGHEESLVAVI